MIPSLDNALDAFFEIVALVLFLGCVFVWGTAV